MQVSLEKLTQAMQKVKKFADDNKNVPGVMLDINENSMKVCYSDGKRAIVEKLDILQGQEPIQGKIVVPYKRLMEIIESCQPSGILATSDFDIEFGSDNIMTINYAKKIKLAPKKGEVQEGEEPEYEEKTVSRFSQKITYAKPEDNIKYGVLSRMDYDSIFDGENPDIWDKSELKDILSRLSTEKNKIIYISRNMKKAFVCNLAHVTDIPITSCENHTIVIHTSVSSALVDMLNKMPGDTVSIVVKDQRYANIRSENNEVGIWFELSPASRTDIVTLERYQQKDYSKYRIIVLREALTNVINCAMSVDNNEKTNLIIGNDDENNLVIKIANANAGQSVANEFAVVIEKCVDADGKLKELQIPVSLKVLHDMLTNCKNYYAALDISIDEQGMYLRVEDLKQDDETGNIVAETTHYTISARA